MSTARQRAAATSSWPSKCSGAARLRAQQQRATRLPEGCRQMPVTARLSAFPVLPPIMPPPPASTTADAYAKSYTSFYAAVTATSDASTCKQIIDTIGLKATMSNPKLALTIFVPSNAVSAAPARCMCVDRRPEPADGLRARARS
jgi:hypothetical protein